MEMGDASIGASSSPKRSFSLALPPHKQKSLVRDYEDEYGAEIKANGRLVQIKSERDARFDWPWRDKQRSTCVWSCPGES